MAEDPKQMPIGNQSAVAMANQPMVISPQTGQFNITGTSAILLLTPASHLLLAHARSLAKEGRHQFAVLFAHAACELHTELNLIMLLNARSDKVLVNLLLSRVSRTKISEDDRICKLYSALTGDDPKKAAWWKEWLISRDDRHVVAHKGAMMDQQQAERAIESAHQYIKHMTAKVEEALKKLGAAPAAS